MDYAEFRQEVMSINAKLWNVNIAVNDMSDYDISEIISEVELSVSNLTTALELMKAREL